MPNTIRSICSVTVIARTRFRGGLAAALGLGCGLCGLLLLIEERLGNSLIGQGLPGAQLVGNLAAKLLYVDGQVNLMLRLRRAAGAGKALLLQLAGASSEATLRTTLSRCNIIILHPLTGWQAGPACS